MTARYDIFELALSGREDGNPFVDVQLEARFFQRNRVLTVPGFYDGDGRYVVRFSPDAEGEWEYYTVSDDAALDGISGSFFCGPAEGLHGPVRVKDTFHFAHADGTAFFPFGTTAYNWVNQPDAVRMDTWKTLSDAPFNKVRMSPFPKHYIYNLDEPPMYPYVGGLLPGKEEAARAAEPFGQVGSECYSFDFSRPNVYFWQYMDGVLLRMRDMGIECDFILFHPYDRWGFSTMPRENRLQYVRYMVARYAAYSNIWWSLANEWDIFREWAEDDWEAVAAEIVRWDWANHLRSIHNCRQFYDYGRGWITHASIQRIDYHMHVSLTDEWRKKWRKPVVIDEVCYEGDLDAGFGNIPGEEMLRRFWETCVRGGYCTHGETFLHENDVIWWGKGGTLSGTSPARIGFLRKIMEESPGAWDMGASEWDLPFANAGKRFIATQTTHFGSFQREYAEYMICYFGYAQPRDRTFHLPQGHKYTVDIIDTWNMTVMPVEGIFEGSAYVKLCSRPYIAVRFREVSA
ncbi:MAG: DUF5605 domain-containing protein [Christensenellales bacterium]|jgi:hypothetical protein